MTHQIHVMTSSMAVVDTLGESVVPARHSRPLLLQLQLQARNLFFCFLFERKTIKSDGVSAAQHWVAVATAVALYQQCGYALGTKLWSWFPHTSPYPYSAWLRHLFLSGWRVHTCRHRSPRCREDASTRHTYPSFVHFCKYVTLNRSQPLVHSSTLLPSWHVNGTQLTCPLHDELSRH